MNEQDYIERNGRRYQYSELDDSWYPVPSQGEYDFQRFVIFISGLILICWVISLFF